MAMGSLRKEKSVESLTAEHKTEYKTMPTNVAEEEKSLPFLSELEALSKEDKDEIEIKSRLKHVEVNNVSRSIKGQFGLKLHGYLVVAGSPMTIHLPWTLPPAKGYLSTAQSVFFGASVMHAPYTVSDQLVAAAQASPDLSDETRRIVQALNGQKFETVSEFIRTLLTQKGMSSEEVYALSAEEPYFQRIKAINQRTVELREKIKTVKNKIELLKPLGEADAIARLTDLIPGYEADLTVLEKRQYIPLLWELHELTTFNTTINGLQGAVFLMDSCAPLCVEDREAFEKKDAVEPIPYPDIRATDVWELKQQQLLFQRAVEEAAGIGFYEETKHSHAVVTQMMRRLVTFLKIPHENNPFDANCNKSTATALQTVEDISAKEMKRKSQVITGASSLAYGSGQRMFLWNSPFHRNVVDLFINREFKEDDLRLTTDVEPGLLQACANQKAYILKVIETWHLPQQKMALEQLLNEKTPLGRVARTEPVSLWHYSDGSWLFLKNVAKQLERVNQEIRGEVELTQDWVTVTL